MSEDEREALDQSAADVREGRFATSEQVAVIFGKYRQVRISERNKAIVRLGYIWLGDFDIGPGMIFTTAHAKIRLFLTVTHIDFRE